MKRRGFLASLLALACAPALIEKIKPKPLLFLPEGKDAYEAYYRSYHKLVTIDRADMQRGGRTFVEAAQRALNELNAQRVEVAALVHPCAPTNTNINLKREEVHLLGLLAPGDCP